MKNKTNILCSLSYLIWVFLLILTPGSLQAQREMGGGDPIHVGDRKQLFIDKKFIDVSNGISLQINPPRNRIKIDQPKIPGLTKTAHVSIFKCGRLSYMHFNSHLIRIRKNE